MMQGDKNEFRPTRDDIARSVDGPAHRPRRSGCARQKAAGERACGVGGGDCSSSEIRNFRPDRVFSAQARNYNHVKERNAR